MTQSLPPPIPSLVPDTAPFSEEQRVWLNGFFAGLVSLDGFGVTPLSGALNTSRSITLPSSPTNFSDRVPLVGNLKSVARYWSPWA